jgi:PAS domain-containing protein
MASIIEKTIGKTETSLALLKVLTENSFDSILVTDASVRGKIIYANKAFKKLTSSGKPQGFFKVREPIKKLLRAWQRR